MRFHVASIVFALSLTAPAGAQLRISQVYPGGGESGMVFPFDYVEVTNAGAADVDVSGFSVQTATAFGSIWAVVPLSGVIPPGGHQLIQLGPGGGGHALPGLPAPDAVGPAASALDEAAHKVALVDSTQTLFGSQPTSASIVDFVGWGFANWQEPFTPSSPKPPNPGQAGALHRRLCGAGDADDNKQDLHVGWPSPRNSASAPAAGLFVAGAAQPHLGAAGELVRFVVAVEDCGGSQVGAAALVTLDLSSLGGSPAAVLLDDGTQGDEVAGDGVYSLETVLPAGAPVGDHHLPAGALFGGSSGAAYASLLVRDGAAPANDEARGAVDLPGPYSPPVQVNADLLQAAAEWNPLKNGAGGPGTGLSRGLWYTVTGTGTTLRASTCGLGGPFTDTRLFVFAGTPDYLTLVAANEDGGPACAGDSASVDWCSSPGQTYLVWVAADSEDAEDVVVPLAISDDGLACGAATLALTCDLPVPPGAQYEVENPLGPDRNAGCHNFAEQFEPILGPLDGAVLTGAVSLYAQTFQADGWSFTAPASEAVRLTFTAAFEGHVRVTELNPDGSCIFASTVAISETTLRCSSVEIVFPVTAGETYALDVDHEFTEFALGGLAPGVRGGRYVIELDAGVAPANDTIAGAQVLFGDAQLGTTSGAANDVPSSCDPSGRDVWYRLGVFSDGTATVDVEGIDTDTAVAVFDSDGVNELACSAGAPGGGALDAQVQAFLTAGSYLVRVSDEGAGSGGNFRISSSQVPAADVAAGAALVEIGGTAAVNVENATADPGLPAVSGPSTPSNPQDLSSTNPGVFFEVRPTADGTLTASTAGSTSPLKLLVFEEVPGSADGAGNNLVPVTGNEKVEANPFGQAGARCSWQAQAGKVYKLWCGASFPGFNKGVAKCTVTSEPTPSNDKCSQAFDILLSDTQALYGTLNGCTAENFEIGGSCPGANNYCDAWYRCTAPVAGTYTFKSCGPNVQMELHSTCPAPGSVQNLNPTSCTEGGTLCDAGGILQHTMQAGESVLVRLVQRELTQPGGTYQFQYSAPGTTGTYFRDLDGDGYGIDNDTEQSDVSSDGYVGAGGDCDDADPLVHPGASEEDAGCDGTDNDCDGVVDLAALKAVFFDADGDGFGAGDPIRFATCSEVLGPNESAAGGDCKDADSTVFPGASELCDGLDNDCDGVVDLAALKQVFFDADGDGFPGTGGIEIGCGDPLPLGFSDSAVDCNDQDPSVFPGVSELCNGADDDCDGFVDEDVLQVFFVDADDDGFGGPQTVTVACGEPQPPLTANNNFDCDDTDPDVHPGVQEVCDGIDNDCNGAADDGTVATFLDQDGDGVGGSPGPQLGLCESLPPGVVETGGDCDDSNPNVFPGANDVCDGLDNDCDGAADNDLVASFVDQDGDGFGSDPGPDFLVCDSLPGGLTAVGGDCNDADPLVFPGAPELCPNGIDEDCDGAVDESCPGADLCSDASPLTDGLTSGDNSLATDEQGLPPLCEAAQNDVWHVYTNDTACARTVEISTCPEDGGDAAFETVLAAYAGTCGDLEPVACAGDVCAGKSKIDFLLQPGESYRVSVSSKLGTPGGAYTLAVSSEEGGNEKLGQGCPQPDLDLDGTPLQVGQPASLKVSGAQAGALGVLYLGQCAEPPLVLLDAACEVFVDPLSASFHEIAAFLADANGEFELPFTVPNNPALPCSEFCWQSVVLEGAGVGVTNALRIVVKPADS